jgi:sucrose-6-phosphate hydrolase SacC (GH32 family)
MTETTVAHEVELFIRNTESSPQPPSFHITAPWGWMNDPCAPGYDQTTGLYHLFYQCTSNYPCPQNG